MNVSLVLIQNDGTIREAILKQGSAVIGRQVGCHIRIPAAEVSRQHCEVLFQGETITLRDLGSANGTLVNGERVDECPLKAGDLVTIGSVNLLLRIDGKPARVDPKLMQAAAGRSNAASGSRVSPASRPPPPKANTPTGKQSVLEELGIDPSKLKNEDSSVADFDFDFEDDDDQPKL